MRRSRAMLEGNGSVRRLGGVPDDEVRTKGRSSLSLKACFLA